MRTVEHEIPGKGEDKTLQQRTCNTYMLSSLLSPNRLTKILSCRIAWKAHHHTWYPDLNPSHNKSWKIRLHIDFRT